MSEIATLAPAVTRCDLSGVIAENIASLRMQEKLGFARDGKAMLSSRPHGGEVPHIATKLTREAFERLSP